MLDNFSVHRATAVRAVIPTQEAADVFFCYPPSYAPELHAIEPLWDRVKYHDLQDRSHTELSRLQAVVGRTLANPA